MHLPSQQHPASTLLSPPSPQTFSLDQLSQQLPVQQLYDQKLLHDYLESQQQQTFADAAAATVDSQPNSFMTGTYDFANPSIRIPQSQVTTNFSPVSMLSANATASFDHWNSYSHVHGGSQSLQRSVQRTGRTHERTSSSSSSSIGSSGSQYQASTSFPSFSNVAHLPTPIHTPTSDSFMNTNIFHSNNNNNNNNNNTYTPRTPHTASMDLGAHMSVKHGLMDQHVSEEEVPGFVHSARHSVSSYGHDSPATPHTTHGDELDFKMTSSDLRQHTVVPKIDRMYTDVTTADYSFDPNVIVTSAPLPPQAKPVANRLLSPYRTSNPTDNLIQRSLQAAQMARSHSPTSSVSRGDSPFRRGSPYRQPTSFQSPRMAVGTAAAAREKKVEADAAYAMKPHIPSGEDAQPKTISPKDALLDYREANDESKAPLFPGSGATDYDQYNGADQYRNATQSTFDTTSQSYRRDSWATPQFSQSFSTSVAGTSQQPSSFAFAAPPSMSGNLHGLPLMSASQYRTTPTMSAASDQTPEFPAHLTSMESSASEAGPEPTRPSSERLLQKPADSSADTGTYTCTYHGCTLRFETPQKLQKHKREGHRNAANLGASMTSAALLERNSQAGPHKCERINPTTGKPCNTIFSRPYDLTRHEDTIHNARKQKVRCALCVEEKTFSRNDALTRHMRVVHPEVDFPGKHRRRGANHD